jgi:hypothetical protein
MATGVIVDTEVNGVAIVAGLFDEDRDAALGDILQSDSQRIVTRFPNRRPAYDDRFASGFPLLGMIVGREPIEDMKGNRRIDEATNGPRSIIL